MTRARVPYDDMVDARRAIQAARLTISDARCDIAEGTGLDHQLRNVLTVLAEHEENLTSPLDKRPRVVHVNRWRAFSAGFALAAAAFMLGTILCR